MLARTALISWGVFVFGVACASTSDNSDDDDASQGTTSNVGASGAGAGTSAPSSTGSGGAGGGVGSGAGGPAAPPVCLPRCTTPADCDLGSPAFDADNYSCDAGHCVYLGCNSDAECQPQGGRVCRPSYDPLMLGNVSICVLPCNTPTECDLGAGPAYDADNYECVAGGCQYIGCHTEAECASQTTSLTCKDLGGGVAFCQTTCATPRDCDLGSGAAYDADNYACTEGVCVYQGCNNDGECISLGDYGCAEP